MDQNFYDECPMCGGAYKMNESTIKVQALSNVQADWIKEHEETQGQHHGLTGPGTSAWSNCVICNPPPTLSDIRRQDLLDEIELDLL